MVITSQYIQILNHYYCMYVPKIKYQLYLNLKKRKEKHRHACKVICSEIGMNSPYNKKALSGD